MKISRRNLLVAAGAAPVAAQLVTTAAVAPQPLQLPLLPRHDAPR